MPALFAPDPDNSKDRPFEGVHDLPRQVVLRGRVLHVADDKPTFWERAGNGTWEPETLEALERLIRPRDAVLDIGAWVGPTTLFSASLGARVLAVEADPRAQALLALNVSANVDLAPLITIVPRAASARSGSVRLGAPRKPGDSMSSVLFAGLENAWDVEAITPDEIVALLPAAERLVVKVDIEGGEYDLMPALASALPAHAHAILVAFHPEILSQAGVETHDIRKQTERVFSALNGFRATALEAVAKRKPGSALDLACESNQTVLFDLAHRFTD